MVGGETFAISVEATLKRASFFSHLTHDQLEMLAGTCRRLALPANHVVFREGDESDGLYVILTGSVRVHRCDHQGNEIDLATLQEGDFFGEAALLEGGI